MSALRCERRKSNARMSLPILQFRDPNIAELDDGVIIVVLQANS